MCIDNVGYPIWRRFTSGALIQIIVRRCEDDKDKDKV